MEDEDVVVRIDTDGGAKPEHFTLWQQWPVRHDFMMLGEEQRGQGEDEEQAGDHDDGQRARP